MTNLLPLKGLQMAPKNQRWYMVSHKEIMDKAIESEGELMVDFGISLPESCFTLVKTEGYDKYYKINCYGDWWWANVIT